MTENEAAENIYEAISNVMQQVGYVQKQSAPGLRYSYAGEAALIEAIRPYMVEQRIVMFPIASEKTTEDFTTSKGYAMTRALVTTTYRFVHAPTDTHFDVVTHGEGMDAGDKAINKAMTGSYKYALRQTFVIETGDDPDKDRPEETGSDTRSNGAKKKAKETAGDSRPYSPKQLHDRINQSSAAFARDIAGKTIDPPSKGDFGAVMGNLEKCFAGDPDSENKRHSVLAYLFSVETGNDLMDGEILALKKWLNATDTGGAWSPDPIAVREAQAVLRERMADLGQEELPVE